MNTDILKPTNTKLIGPIKTEEESGRICSFILLPNKIVLGSSNREEDQQAQEKQYNNKAHTELLHRAEIETIYLNSSGEKRAHRTYEYVMTPDHRLHSTHARIEYFNVENPDIDDDPTERSIEESRDILSDGRVVAYHLNIEEWRGIKEEYFEVLTYRDDLIIEKRILRRQADELIWEIEAVVANDGVVNTRLVKKKQGLKDANVSEWHEMKIGSLRDFENPFFSKIAHLLES